MTETLPASQLPSINQFNDLDETLDFFYDYILATFNCHRVGIIQSFNPSTQRAVVQPVEVLRKTTTEGQQLITSAPLIDCPVIIPYGLLGGFNFPITEGLECLICFNDKDLDIWKKTGNVAPPRTYRLHNITDGVCLPSVRSNPKAASYDNESVGMTYEGGAKIKLDSKIEFANQSQNLKILIESLIDLLQNLKVVDPVSGELPINGSTSAALTGLLAQFNELLK